ncbi:T-cell activation inhibitor, mitochondrial-like [Musca domestica]|uniref:T-cell activation inhibitor, mitochondrial-like n=1 Tax=Musca domestica TaxID=7370 RepID=A0ABM3VPI0_MUSDO|nr:T-cell activation inhibitor, mitochondrial-like [Musca domestica]XP_058987691.1 T-cell activation inhibitor, mitochondrial-like [Musca domestica]
MLLRNVSCFGAKSYQVQRCLNVRTISTELAAALRPFYFAVHPDLFGQHPEQRTVNEESLKQLSAHMQMIHERKYSVFREAKVLKFYIREDNGEDRNKFKLIQLTLDNKTRDPKTIITKLLELCNLPTEYVKSLKSSPVPEVGKNMARDFGDKGSGFRSSQDYNYGSQFAGFESAYYRAKEETKKSVDEWIAENSSLAKKRAKDLQPLKRDVEVLQKAVIENLGLKDARYDCGWNFEHYRGCLKTLERLASLHKDHVKHLRGRVVVFAPFTGISLEGHVMLFTGDVLNNWIEFIRNIPKHDAFLKKIPLYENTLSQVLRKIRIGRRKFMPKQQAVEYANHLNKVTTTLGDYLTLNKFPKSWPDTLSEYEIVIESEAGPLMVSPTGQLITPATCPGFMLVDFITTNLPIAKERVAKYQEEKHVERELTKRCIEEMRLKSLTKDDSVTPEKMINTLNELLKCNKMQFADIDLHITNYYSVLTDGIVCIPWDFNTRR